MLKSKRVLLLYFAIFLLLSLISCRSDARIGETLTGKSYEGLSTKDLYDPKARQNNFIELKFKESGVAEFKGRRYYYYDCEIPENSYMELKPQIKTAMQIFPEDMSDTESDVYTREIFTGLQKSDTFVLSTKKLSVIDVKLDEEKFNFNGYLGLGWHDGENYMIGLLATNNLKRGYLFGE